jgi:hypothetical protein
MVMMNQAAVNTAALLRRTLGRLIGYWALPKHAQVMNCVTQLKLTAA